MADDKKGFDEGMRRFQDMLGGMNFKTEEELKAFMEGMVGKKIDDLVVEKKENMSPAEEAQELVYQAMSSQSPLRVKELAEAALKLDPDSGEAWLLISDVEPDMKKSVELLEKSMAASKRKIGAEKFERARGYFWGIHETRPYMRAKANYTEAQYTLGNVEEALNSYREMMELNPNDNQGMRYRYATVLVTHNLLTEYEALHKKFPDEYSASWQFTYAAYLFRERGPSALAKAEMKKAAAMNKHVYKYLAGEKPFPKYVPESYVPGSEEDALIYVRDSAEMWVKTPGLLPFYITMAKKGGRLKRFRKR